MTRIPGRNRIRIASAKKATVAAEMYASGSSWKEIADELGMRSQAGVRQLVERHIEKLPRVATTTVRQMLLERLAKAHEAALSLLDDRDKAIRLRAADVVARVAERIAKLHGLESIAVQHALAPQIETSGSSWDLATLTPPQLVLLMAIKRHADGEATAEQVVEAARSIVAEADAAAAAAKLAALPARALLPAPAENPFADIYGPKPPDTTSATDDDDDAPIELA